MSFWRARRAGETTSRWHVSSPPRVEVNVVELPSSFADRGEPERHMGGRHLAVALGAPERDGQPLGRLPLVAGAQLPGHARVLLALAVEVHDLDLETRLLVRRVGAGEG